MPSLSESGGWKNHNLLLTTLFVIVLSRGVPLYAQVPEGSIGGRVRDAGDSRGIEGVRVSVIGPEGYELMSAETNSSGDYRFLFVMPGHYGLKFQKTGYLMYIFRDVRIQNSRTSFVALQMQKNLADGQNPVYFDWRSWPDNPWGSAYGTIFDRWQLDNLPSPHNIWALLENQETSGITNRIDEGGISTGLVALVGVHGSSWTQNGYR